MRRSSNDPYLKHKQQEQQDEESQGDYDQQMRNRKSGKGKSAPRFIKNKIEQINLEEIVLNISRTHYPIIETVGRELGWKIQESKKSETWDIMWVDGMIQAHDLFKLHTYQKISHFPAISVISRKDLLGRGLIKMSKFFPNSYNFFPYTWSIPADSTDLLLFHNSRLQENLKQYYIFKPEASSQGRGISLTDQVQTLLNKTGVVQMYINDPLLIDGLKFDLRIYVLVSGCDPLRIFIYEEGLARFATESYVKAKKKNIKDTCMHLTNYAINKLNNKFVFNQDVKNMHTGHKRSLTSVYSLLEKRGVDIRKIKSQIDDIIVKTLIIGQPMLAHIYGLSQPDNFANDMCFQILGFDILLTEKHQAVLLEVNHTPSFICDTPLDNHIKKTLIKDTLRLLKVNVKTKLQKFNQKQEFLELRSQRKNVHYTNIQKKTLKAQLQIERDAYEELNLGKFRKLYPLLNKDYQQMLKCSKQIFDDHYGFKKKGKSLKVVPLQKASSLQHSSPVHTKKLHHLDIGHTSQFGQRSQSRKMSPNTISFNNSQHLPKIDKKKEYVCPIISEIQKIPFSKFRSKQGFNYKKDIQTKKESSNNNQGAYLVPKMLNLDEGQITTKTRIFQIQQSMLEKFSSSAKLRYKKLEPSSLLNSLILKKLESS